MYILRVSPKCQNFSTFHSMTLNATRPKEAHMCYINSMSVPNFTPFRSTTAPFPDKCYIFLVSSLGTMVNLKFSKKIVKLKWETHNPGQDFTVISK